MIEEKAKHLIDLYVDGWRENDIEKVLSSLSDACTIIESHGPTYRGKRDVKEWMDRWVKGAWKVNAWNIISFFFTKNTAVFEWKFSFSSHTEKPRTIEGITLMQFKHDKIDYLREYRTTKPLFQWAEGRKLHTY